jgi:polar amino acid transport system permease protein
MIHALAFRDFEVLLLGFEWTILLSAVAFIGSAALGLALLALRMSRYGAMRGAALSFIHGIQGTPLLGLLFLIYFGLALFGFDVSPWTASTVGLSVYGCAFLSDIWEGAVRAIPKGQWEASRVLGLNFWRQFRLVILPQALTIAIPPTVGFLVQLIKNTSVASIIGMVELSRDAQIVSASTFEVFNVYALVCGLYFILCYPLTWYSRRLELRLSHAR